jgi:hypothetical protein
MNVNVKEWVKVWKMEWNKPKPSVGSYPAMKANGVNKNNRTNPRASKPIQNGRTRGRAMG